MQRRPRIQPIAGLRVRTGVRAGAEEYRTSGNLFCEQGNRNCELIDYDNRRWVPRAECAPMQGSVGFDLQ